MSGPLDEEYFVWLYSQIGSVKSRNPTRKHWGLAKQLYTKEFIWLVPNDDNRAEDGRALRWEFMHENDVEEPDPEWMSLGCSMFEMLLGLSRRLSFDGEGEPRGWFWEILENMGIGMARCSDRLYDEEIAKTIDDALDRVIWRIYSPSGLGGMFPLPGTKKDQRYVEIWYQMSEYLVSDF
jgi:hypothetical protein